MTTRNESDVDPISIARNGGQARKSSRAHRIAIARKGARRGRIRALRGTTIAVEHRPLRWGTTNSVR